MKVSKKQAQENRAHIVATASALFRERGYDGVGIADLMAAAGFTQGGFYKHFNSKADLMAESSACGIEQSAALLAGASAEDFVKTYLARDHRDHRATGCTLAALCADAARKEETVRTTFAAGIEAQLAALCEGSSEADGPDAAQVRAKHLALMAHALGAVVMSRACPDDSPLADEILAVCRDAILGMIAPAGTAEAAEQEK
ncbi:TetR family transcriptional regulator [Pseudomonas corrugata]|uniref:TetR family transcriptional regulator n=1 Tax=Pseudomonas corrugata TaxID=47879 RepID=A0A7Y5Z3E3_9PSED|nr:MULTISPECIES: TetR family transcriptional regulator [Pseudomonas]MCI0997417.1 TetR family transcriptional regulator [Pseudomonas corrugata]NUT67142.1 TetR family transcriptional regulator [Pseudomonas corrugata]NUT86295.1 TetR family transcriptional regulator [Pseudomonas corrugata]TNF79992.1 TetR family transcriptional regulator [Pseudomonas sp. ICMP22404]